MLLSLCRRGSQVEEACIARGGRVFIVIAPSPTTIKILDGLTCGRNHMLTELMMCLDLQVS